MRNEKWLKRMLAAGMAAAMLAGTSLTALAETVVSDGLWGWRCYEDDGSIGANKWAQNDRGGWLYFGPDGTNLTGECDRIYPVGVGSDGSIYVDFRMRSVTGQPGQQPVLSMPGTGKDIRYKGLRQMLDSIPLYPDATTGIPELDAMLDQIFAQIITPDMDTHDKLKACYDYLILNMKDGRYEELGPDEGMVITFSFDDGSEEPAVSGTCQNAYDLLQGGVGVCDTYSACFAVMAWKLGLPMYIAGGETSRSGGGYTPHAWCQLDGPDGTTYVFDPHVDYLITLRGGGAPSNVRFGPTHAQVAGKYAHIDSIFDI